MELIKERLFNEPKLLTPKFMNNKTKLGTIEFYPMNKKSVACFVYKYDDCYYIHHRDYASPFIPWQDAEKLGIQRPKKFIYGDGGGIVLRCEAIIKITEQDMQAPLFVWNKSICISNLCINFAIMTGETKDKYKYIASPWDNMFEEFFYLIEKVKKDENSC